MNEFVNSPYGVGFVVIIIFIVWISIELKLVQRIWNWKNSDKTDEGYSFIESPMIKQVVIKIETMDEISGIESLNEAADIIWNYNQMKDTVEQVKEEQVMSSEDLINSILGPADENEDDFEEVEQKVMIDGENVGRENEYAIIPEVDPELLKTELDELEEEQGFDGNAYVDYSGLEENQ